MSNTEIITPERPWVLPEEVRAYSDLEYVQSRSDEKLAVDISRAESYVLTYTHNQFEGYETIPEDVKIAVILLAEAYAYNSVVQTNTLKSETFDDYSYTAENSAIDISTLSVGTLLDPWIIAVPSGRVTMRLRKL